MNRTIFLIILLVVSAAGLLALSLNLKPAPTTTAPVSIAQTTLAMTTPAASASGVLESDIQINTNGNTTTAAQIELSYNPKDLGDVDIVAGNFFKNPLELFKKIDDQNGRISYALGGSFGDKGIAGSGIVAKLSFKKLRTTGTTSVAFMPKSRVTSSGISQSVLRSATGLTLDLSK